MKHSRMHLIIEIKVVPSSGKMQWKLNKAEQLVCYLKSPPERGLANHELIKELSKALKIARVNISIATGQTSRLKRIEIKDASITYADVLRSLGIEPQLSLFKT